ncbi:Alanine dehydrogenase/(1)-pyrroline-2-carboxylate reductase ProC [Halalkaliarchaeum sp. AArc-CO]|uniref:ornithine cyclodeaminase family protein n=1 Tax=unclassified Halalkaliarchaeum TaxID=2678344 RepID=UPI00217E983D|nr:MULTISPECIES: ornithine cyclodeaminase family protein [unclassified Halalkaliarchaeum]MDR5673059.1 ornithine cyclodeaminase family protein [Halalkaliarchaeum sp. AArc-GB]UWG49534.1 Alanine dehydrogenase/(1)-pyrroline-2-carboxylate reductase ProC [Halalkaliarchaeum sp. AArc-CO]
MQTLLLDSDAVAANAPMDRVVPALESAFAAYERGDAQMPAKSYIELPEYNGDFRSMPAYMDAGDWDAAGVKWVNVHPDNEAKYDLPTVMGTMIYSDPENAFPLAIMDGTELTTRRTGAAAAVATDHLAVEDATSLGIVGAGVQAYTQLEAIAEVRPIETVVISDVDEARVAAFVEAFEDRFEVCGGSTAEAAECDVLSTVTPVREPIISSENLGEHTHVNAMGADAAGKQELESEILQEAKLVIDDYDQCTHSGEINVPWSEGLLEDGDIYGEIGEIVVGNKPGRTPEDGVTVFDSTGLAIQDVATAHVVYEHADENDNGTPFDLLGLA